MNYITDRNSFALVPPPAWWLVKMAAFDPKLVLIPSRFKRRHLLCRRVGQFSRGLAPLTIGRSLDPDTAMCIEHGLVQISWIDCANWSQGALDYLLAELKARDTWPIEGRPMDETDLKRAAFEGETKVSRLLDDRDAVKDATIDRQNHERVYQASGEAWRYRQHVTGSRVLSAGRAHVDPNVEIDVMSCGVSSMLPGDPHTTGSAPVVDAGMPKHTVDTSSAT